MTNNGKQPPPVGGIGDRLQSHQVIKVCTAIGGALGVVLGAIAVSDWLSRKSPTLNIGEPFVVQEPSRSRRSKHVRVPIIASYEEVRTVEAFISKSDPPIPRQTGKDSLLFAREYKPGHTHNDPEEASWSPEDKLRHFRTQHFSKVQPIDIQIGETEKINVLVKIEGWDERSFLGNDNMDELANAGTHTFTLRITAQNASSEELTFTVVHANSYTDIAVKQNPKIRNVVTAGEIPIYALKRFDDYATSLVFLRKTIRVAREAWPE